jgi:hypothetical protein
MSKSQITPSPAYRYLLDLIANGDVVTYCGEQAGRFTKIVVRGDWLEHSNPLALYFDVYMGRDGDMHETKAGRLFYIGNGIDGLTVLCETAEMCAEHVQNQLITAIRRGEIED